MSLEFRIDPDPEKLEKAREAARRFCADATGPKEILPVSSLLVPMVLEYRVEIMPATKEQGEHILNAFADDGWDVISASAVPLGRMASGVGIHIILRRPKLAGYRSLPEDNVEPSPMADKIVKGQ